MNASLARLPLMMLMLGANLSASAQLDVRPVRERRSCGFSFYCSCFYRSAAGAVQCLKVVDGLSGAASLHSRQVREKRISPTRVEVWQEGVVQALFFQVRLVSSLEMEETPERRVVFNQVSGDLQSYSGEWNLVKARDGTTVSYEATITLQPEQFAPAFLVKSVLEKEVTERFEALAGEALKRANKAVPECVSDK